MSTIREWIVLEAIDNTLNAFNSVQTNTENTTRSLDGMRMMINVLAGLTIGGGLISSLAQISDQLADAVGKLKSATNSIEEYDGALKSLEQTSLATGTQLTSNITLFARINNSIKEMGHTSESSNGFVDAMAKALKISSASVGEADSAIVQMSQALASGALRGDEFNTVNEASPRIMQAIANSLNVTSGALRGLAEQGKLTADVVVKGLLAELPKLTEEAKKIPVTITRAIENVKTQAQVFFSTYNAGFNSTIANTITSLSENIETIGKGILGLIAIYTVAKFKSIALARASAIATMRSLADENLARTEATAVQARENSARLREVQIRKHGALVMKRLAVEQFREAKALAIQKARDRLIAVKYDRDILRGMTANMELARVARVTEHRNAVAREIDNDRQQIALNNLLLAQNRLNASQNRPTATRAGNVGEYQRLLREEQSILRQRTVIDDKLTADRTANQQRLGAIHRANNAEQIAHIGKIERADAKVARTRIRNARSVDKATQDVIKSQFAVRRAMVANATASEASSRAIILANEATTASFTAVSVSASPTTLQRYAFAFGRLNAVVATGETRFQAFAIANRRVLLGIRSNTIANGFLARSFTALGVAGGKFFSAIFGLWGLLAYMVYEVAKEFFDIGVAIEVTYVALKRYVAEAIHFITVMITKIPIISHLMDFAGVSESFVTELDMMLESVETLDDAITRMQKNDVAKGQGFKSHADKLKNGVKVITERILKMERIYVESALTLNTEMKKAYANTKDQLDAELLGFSNHLEDKRALKTGSLHALMGETERFQEAKARLENEDFDKTQQKEYENLIYKEIILGQHYDKIIKKVSFNKKAVKRIELEKLEALDEIANQINTNQRASIDKWVSMNAERLKAVQDIGDEVEDLEIDLKEFLRGNKTEEESEWSKNTRRVSDYYKVKKALRKIESLDEINDSKEIGELFERNIKKVKKMAKADKKRAEESEKYSLDYIVAVQSKYYAEDLLVELSEKLIDSKKRQAKQLEAESAKTLEMIKSRTDSMKTYREKIAELDKDVAKQRNLVIQLDMKDPIEKLKRLQKSIADLKRELANLKVEVGNVGKVGKVVDTSITAPTQIIKRQTGGWIPRQNKLDGYGGGDRVRALLERGEFIINKSATRKIGDSTLHRLNAGDTSIIKRKTGGGVGDQDSVLKEKLKRAKQRRDDLKAKIELSKKNPQRRKDKAVSSRDAKSGKFKTNDAGIEKREKHLKSQLELRTHEVTRIERIISNLSTVNSAISHIRTIKTEPASVGTNSSEQSGHNDKAERAKENRSETMIKNARNSWQSIINVSERDKAKERVDTTMSGRSNTLNDRTRATYAGKMISGLEGMKGKNANVVQRAIGYSNQIINLAGSRFKDLDFNNKINGWLADQAELLRNNVNIPTVANTGSNTYKAVNLNGSERGGLRSVDSRKNQINQINNTQDQQQQFMHGGSSDKAGQTISIKLDFGGGKSSTGIFPDNSATARMLSELKRKENSQ